MVVSTVNDDEVFEADEGVVFVPPDEPPDEESSVSDAESVVEIAELMTSLAVLATDDRVSVNDDSPVSEAVEDMAADFAWLRWSKRGEGRP
jgi:hypothetical protein